MHITTENVCVPCTFCHSFANQSGRNFYQQKWTTVELNFVEHFSKVSAPQNQQTIEFNEYGFVCVFWCVCIWQRIISKACTVRGHFTRWKLLFTSLFFVKAVDIVEMNGTYLSVNVILCANGNNFLLSSVKFSENAHTKFNSTNFHIQSLPETARELMKLNWIIFPLVN